MTYIKGHNYNLNSNQNLDLCQEKGRINKRQRRGNQREAHVCKNPHPQQTPSNDMMPKNMAGSHHIE